MRLKAPDGHYFARRSWNYILHVVNQGTAVALCGTRAGGTSGRHGRWHGFGQEVDASEMKHVCPDCKGLVWR